MDAPPARDPELEALRLAILLEEELGVTLTDAEIDLAVLTDPSAVRSIAGRRGEPPGGEPPGRKAP